jgi:peptidoglycan/LPS O-acetylase OafA/YrhL
MIEARQRRTERRLTLDAVKGLLVLLMVLYHWLNYFVTSDGDVYKYIRFITPSFVFVTGFLITNVYLDKYRIGDRSLHKRLFVRGLKLLVLFTVLNLAANAALKTNYNGAELNLSHFFAIAPTVYLSGDGRGAAFEVLLPIGYLLAASSVLLWGCKLSKHFLHGFWLALLGSIYVLQWQNMGSANVELFAMGLLGMVFGCYRLEAMDRAARPYVVWFAAYAVYLGAVSIYNVIYALQIVGLILNLALLYMAARQLGETGAIAPRVILLGQYSLLAYIVHIGILQVLAHLMRPIDPGNGTSVLSLVIALALTLGFIEATSLVRHRSRLVDTLYRFVFA